jgi:hypothetical protein
MKSIGVGSFYLFEVSVAEPTLLDGKMTVLIYINTYGRYIRIRLLHTPGGFLMVCLIFPLIF